METLTQFEERRWYLNVILADIREERERQVAKFGDQRDVAHGTGGSVRAFTAGEMRRQCDEDFKAGRGTWRAVLQEEVAEAMAEEPHSVALRKELIQVATVAVAWIEALDWHKLHPK